MSENIDKLRGVFRESLMLEPDVNVDALTYRSVAQWDSVAHMQLIANIEGVFDVMLGTEDVIALSSFEEARRLLSLQGVAF